MSKPLRRRPAGVRMPGWGVYVAESVHADDFRSKWMRHSYLKLLYILRGEGELSLEGKVTACRAGDLIVVPIGQSHRLTDAAGRPVALYFLCLSPALWRHEPGLVGRLRTGVWTLEPGLDAAVQRTLRRLLFEQAHEHTGRAVAMVSLAGGLLVELARQTSRRPARAVHAAGELAARMERYVAQLQTRFADAESIDGAAQRLGMSRRRFTQLFRKQTGASWQRYVRGLRVAYAKRLLRTTDRSVTAVAFECGFGDLSNFYRVFRRETGGSPERWRGGEVGGR